MESRKSYLIILNQDLNGKDLKGTVNNNKILNNSSQFICVDDICLGRY